MAKKNPNAFLSAAGPLLGKVLNMGFILAWLQGKKTYIVAAAGALSALAGYLDGNLTAAAAGQTILISLLAMTGRAAVQKSQDAAK